MTRGRYNPKDADALIADAEKERQRRLKTRRRAMDVNILALRRLWDGVSEPGERRLLAECETDSRNAPLVLYDYLAERGVEPTSIDGADYEGWYAEDDEGASSAEQGGPGRVSAWTRELAEAPLINAGRAVNQQRVIWDRSARYALHRNHLIVVAADALGADNGVDGWVVGASRGAETWVMLSWTGADGAPRYAARARNYHSDAIEAQLRDVLAEGPNSVPFMFTLLGAPIYMDAFVASLEDIQQRVAELRQAYVQGRAPVRDAAEAQRQR